MNCLFCKCASGNSKSVEHIIPESLGNKEHILPKGYVCDNCNNYFAVKIEGQLLRQKYFENLRYRNRIYNKKGRLIPNIGIIGTSPVYVHLDDDGVHLDINDGKTIMKLINGTIKHIIIPVGEFEPLKENAVLSRFLAKAAIESFLHRIIDSPRLVKEVYSAASLEPIKQYARYGKGVKYWKYTQRKIYDEGTLFIRPEEDSSYQVFHEFDFIFTKGGELYFVLAIMGIEYAINMGYSSTDSYINWLEENNYKSILDGKEETRMKV